MRRLWVIAALALAACGADGPPAPPAGVTFGAEVQLDLLVGR